MDKKKIRDKKMTAIKKVTWNSKFEINKYSLGLNFILALMAVQVFWGIPALAGTSTTWTAEYFSMGESGKVGAKPQYIQTTEEKESEGFIEWNSVLKDQTQTIVMTETVKMKGLQVIEQTLEQLQIGEMYKLKFESGSLYFETYKIKNATAKDIQEKYKLEESTKITSDGNFLMGPSTHLFFKTEWERLMKGESIKKEFGIFELQKLVSFGFKKESETDENLIIAMEPSNFFVSMFVKKILITLDKKTKKMLRYSGRTPARIQLNGKWEPFDSEIMYKF